MIDLLGFLQGTVPTVHSRFLWNRSGRHFPNKIARVYKHEHDAPPKAKKIQATTLASNESATDKIIKLKKLLDSGAITQAEFDTKKNEILK